MNMRLNRNTIVSIAQIAWLVLCFGLGYNVLHLVEKSEAAVIALFIVSFGGIIALGLLQQRAKK